MKTILKSFMPLVVSLLFLTGCGDSQQAGGKVELNKPVAEIQQDAQKMDVADLQKQAETYKKALEGKMTELESLEKKLKDMPVSKMLSEDAGNLKNQISDTTKSASQITERLNVYLQELKKKNVDISQYQPK